MSLSDDLRDEAAIFVRSAFYDRERIVTIFLEELYAPGDLDPQLVESIVDAALASYEEEKKAWPDVTDNDRLESAFDALRSQGVIALHNAGNTQSDGFSDFHEEFANAPDKSKILGYCFYHWQDVERAVTGGGLYLAFGPSNPKEEETRGVEVGKLITTALQQHGLHSSWDGTFHERILISDFDWKRR